MLWRDFSNLPSVSLKIMACLCHQRIKNIRLPGTDSSATISDTVVTTRSKYISISMPSSNPTYYTELL
jgi:hypothetical protein